MQPKLPTEKVSKINHILAGNIIRKARSRAGKSLRWLANELDVSAPFLSDLECGRRNWTQERFEKALAILVEQESTK